MQRQFTLEYWIDDGWYVGKLQEVPGVFSQGESLEELEENLKELHQELNSGAIPCIRRIGELRVA